MTETTSGWTVDRLKDVAEINLDTLGTNTPEDFAFGYLEISNVNYFGIVSEDAIEQIRFEDAPSRARRAVKSNDVLVSSVRPNLQAIAHIGNLGDGNLICSTGFNVVTSKRHKVFDKFLYWFLLSEGTRQYFEAVAKGVGYPALDDKDFEATNIPLFPIPVQKRIAAYLDASCAAIDRAVEAKQKQLETLDTLRKSIIQKAVTQGIDPKVELKYSGVDWLGSIPSHWTVARIKRHATMVRGKFTHRPRNDPAFFDGPYPFFQTGSIARAEKYIAEYHQTLNEAGLAVSKMFPKGTVVMSIAANIGDVAITDFEGCFPDSIIGFIPDHHTDTDFLFYLLKSMKPVMLRSAILTTQLNINYVRIGANYCAYPPKDEQRAIAEYLDNKMRELSELTSNLNDQITTLINYRKSLIHECVTGKRRITEADLAKVGANGCRSCQ